MKQPQYPARYKTNSHKACTMYVIRVEAIPICIQDMQITTATNDPPTQPDWPSSDLTSLIDDVCGNLVPIKAVFIQLQKSSEVSEVRTGRLAQPAKKKLAKLVYPQPLLTNHERRSSLCLRVFLQNAGDQALTSPVRHPVQTQTGGAAVAEIQRPLGHKEPVQRQRLQVHQNQLQNGSYCERGGQSDGPERHLQVPTSGVHYVDRPQRRVVQIRRRRFDLLLPAGLYGDSL